MKTENENSARSTTATTSTAAPQSRPPQQASGSPGQDPARPNASKPSEKSAKDASDPTPKPTGAKKSDKPDAKPHESTVGTPASEADFLAQQQEHARLAIQRVWTEMGQALKDAGDVRQWFRAYPWATAGAAAAAGLLVGWMVIPSKKREEKAHEAAIRDVRARLEVLREAISEK